MIRLVGARGLSRVRPLATGCGSWLAAGPGVRPVQAILGGVPSNAPLAMRELSSTAQEQNEQQQGQGLAASNAGRKRFYKDVSVVPSLEVGDKGQQFMVALDGRPVKTPHRNALVVRSRTLAQALAYEWDAQEKFIVPSAMPLMTLSCTAIDIAEDRRQGTQKELLRFLRTDTILFPGIEGEDDPKLIRRQRQHWDPLVAWMRETFGPVHECTDLGIPPHPDETVTKVESFLDDLDAWELSAVESWTTGLKSIIIPLALYHGIIDVSEAVQASRVEEEHQVSQWGLVEGGHDVDRAQLIAQVAAASFFLKAS